MLLGRLATYPEGKIAVTTSVPADRNYGCDPTLSMWHESLRVTTTQAPDPAP